MLYNVSVLVSAKGLNIECRHKLFSHGPFKCIGGGNGRGCNESTGPLLFYMPLFQIRAI